VHRKYASKGVMDLVCVCCEEWLDEGIGVCQVDYVQCKTNGKISLAEKTEFLKHCAKFNARPILAYKDAKRRLVIETLSS
jgi:hypothetical protein